MTLTFKHLPLNMQHSLMVISIFLLAIFAWLFNEHVSEVLVYQHKLINQGQLWRLVTGHFLHTNLNHLLLNLAALVLLWLLHGHFYSVKNYSLLFISSALVCSVGLFYCAPNVQQYVGLSGVLHGIFIFGAIMDIRHQDKTGYLLLTGVWLKIAYEQLYGASEQVANLINATVAIDAHLWGAIGGLLFSCGYLLLNKNISQSSADN